MIDKKLINKYNVSGPRYTSYPPANFFTEAFTINDYQNAVIESNSKGERKISVYIHIPFCQSLCLFCGCTTTIRPPRPTVDRYLDALETEMKTAAAMLDGGRKLIQLHWGGGTPHSIGEEGVVRVMNLVRELFEFDPAAEIAMECHPGYVDLEFFDFLAQQGFNRVSLGVQDFNPEVLRKINRKMPKRALKDIVNHLKSLNIRVNFDLVYGLPGQTVADFEDTIKQTIEAQPHRIATFSYAHVPWVKKAQEVLEKYTRIEGAEKWDLLYFAYTELKRAGYIAIGMDHFALPDDVLVEALSEFRLHRNFQGYTTHQGQVYAFGSSGISQLQGCYAQNKKETMAYIESIEQGAWATDRGYILNEKEEICAKVITQIMCNLQIDISPLLPFFTPNLDELVADGMLTVENNVIKITEQGRFFVRNIAMQCDPFLNTENSYSKTI